MERKLSDCIARGEMSETEKGRRIKGMDEEHARERDALQANSKAVEQEQEQKLQEELNEQQAAAIKESLGDALKKVT